MSRLARPVQVQVLRHVNLALANVLLDQICVLLRVLTVERISLRRHVVKAAAERPNVCLICQKIVWTGGENLRRRIIQMTGKGGAFKQLLEVVWHPDQIPLD